MQLKTILCAGVLLGAASLSGCASKEEIAMAQSVITALPQEVTDCYFVGNVDTSARATIKSARFELLLMTARLGGTHLVETHAYAELLGFRDVGVALSGRAYQCPVNKVKLLENRNSIIKEEQDKRDEEAKAQAYRQQLNLLNLEDGLFTL